MKKNTKSMLISALILFCAGLILALGSALFVKIRGIDLYGTPSVSTLREDMEYTLNDILSHSPDSNYMKKLAKQEYARVSVSTYFAEVKIVSTDGPTKVVLEDANTTNLKIQVIGETLTIEEIDPVGIAGIFIDDDGFSFKGLRQLFGHGNSAATEQKIKLYLSNDISIDQLDVVSKAGNTQISALTSERVNIETTFGNILVDSLSTKHGKLNIKGSISNVELKNLTNVTATVTTKIGNIAAEIGGVDAEFNTILETFFGNVSVTTEDPTTFYKLGLTTKLGEITRNGKSNGTSLSDSSTTAKRITASTILGNISLQFKGEDESLYTPEINDDIPVDEETPATEETPLTPLVSN